MAVPFIAPERRFPELTVKAVLLGIFLSVVLGAANAYLGLRVGMTVSASIPAAVVSMAVLRLFRRSNILENNAVQTAASAGESLAAGVIFTIPALIILGHWSEVGYVETTLLALTGGILGVLFTVPLRRALIVEAQLLFPEGVATSQVLQSGGEGKEPSDAVARDRARLAFVQSEAKKTRGSARLAALAQVKLEQRQLRATKRDVRRARRTPGAGALVLGALAGLVIKFMEGGLHMWRATAEVAVRIREQGVAALGLDMAPALLGVGYIIGIRIAVLVFAGGVIGWVVAMPLYSLLTTSTIVNLGGAEVDYLPVLRDSGPSDAAGILWSGLIRYMGVGAMLVGGVWSLIKLRGPLINAVRQGLGAKTSQGTLRTEQEFGMKATFLATLAMIVPIFLLYWYATRSLGPAHSLAVAGTMALLMVVTGFLFSAVAAYMAGLVGSSNNPISGVTILTVLTSAFALLALGVPSDLGPAATIFVAAIIACAGAIGGDNMQDLKAGHLLGSTPRKQQWMQVIGVTAAALAIAPVLQVLHEAHTFGSEELAAPQAGLMAAVGTFVFEGGLPMTMIAIGAGIAVLLIIVDELLAARGSSFRTPVMPVAVGIYLPVGLTTPIFFGGLLAWGVARWYGKSPRQEEGLRTGILFASGAIAGEAIVGILLAFLAVRGVDWAISDGTLVWPGIVMFTFLALVLAYVAMRPGVIHGRR